MLVELLVENFAVAEKLRLRFHAGLNLLTGETGSGKSILVDALGLLLGARAGTGMVRAGASQARISGIFDVARHPALLNLLAEAGIEWGDEDLLIEREVGANGKSRAFVASRPATVSLLREIAPFLGDIHGQHDQQQLFDPNAQLALLDDYAGHPQLLEAVRAAWASLLDLRRQIEELDRNEREKLRLADLWRMQLREIEAVTPLPGEDAELETESHRLKNATKLEDLCREAYTALYDSQSSAAAQTQRALRKLEDLARIDGSLQSAVETLRPAGIAIEEVSLVLRDYASGLEASPARLDEVEGRLVAIDKLKRKYGATIEDILTFLEDLKRKLDALDNAAEYRDELTRQIAEAEKRYQSATRPLTESRRAAAERLAKAVEGELADLAMPRAVFTPELSPGPDGASGQDSMQFLLSANLGEEPKPLDRIASGGELSRTALALKTSLAAVSASRVQADEANEIPRTLVFDEVDSGIGGRAAESVGRKLKQLAAKSQVLCVTHLPQIASFADHHYSVEKVESNGRTVSRIRELDDPARTAEVGRMLSGEQLTSEALRNAEQLIRANRPR
ncbi:MAG: DNA repair protein RecN [Bryobacterales bacterium]|nr:DNA repair protein RecN [Bryobacterales bacterium]